MNKAVVGFGLVNKDYVAFVPAWERDQKTTATHYFEQVGGPVPVALQTIARLGTTRPVSLLGVVGDDRDGEDIAQLLGETGVQAGLVTRAAPGVMTGKSLVILDARDGSRTLASVASHLPPMTFTAEQEAWLSRAALLHLDGRDLEASLRAAEIVKGRGGIVSLDLGTMRPDRERLFPWCDIILASRRGGAGAFPAATTPTEQVRRFLDAGARIAGVTLAAGGVVIGERGSGEPVPLPAYSVANVVDTCGAGDTFHGAFLWAHLRGESAVACANFAQAATAVRITRRGNQAGLPRLDEVTTLLVSAPPVR